MICARCDADITENCFRTYKNGSKRSICKKCDNDADKEYKKSKRRTRQESTLVQCSRCEQTKALKEFAKLKKYDKKICALCYPQYVSECKTQWCADERKRNANYRIKKSLAARLRTVLRKETTTMTYIGCNVQFLREWLAYNFTPEMNWDNYGTYWFIDHVIPISKFDLTNSKQTLICWNWTNLMPVTFKYNCSKKNSIDDKQIEDVKKKLKQFKEEGSTTKWFSEDICPFKI